MARTQIDLELIILSMQAIQKLGQSDVESARKLIMPIIEDVNLCE